MAQIERSGQQSADLLRVAGETVLVGRLREAGAQRPANRDLVGSVSGWRELAIRWRCWWRLLPAASPGAVRDSGILDLASWIVSSHVAHNRCGWIGPSSQTQEHYSGRWIGGNRGEAGEVGFEYRVCVASYGA